MAKKKAPTKKKKAPGIQIHFDLGAVKATPEQIARLRAYLNSTVMTWVKSDLKRTAPIICGDVPTEPCDDE